MCSLTGTQTRDPQKIESGLSRLSHTAAYSSSPINRKPLHLSLPVISKFFLEFLSITEQYEFNSGLYYMQSRPRVGRQMQQG
jgi:hypothetical protein